MKFGIFLLGLAGFLLKWGWGDFWVAHDYAAPRVLSCAQFLAAPREAKWVSVSDCVVFLGNYEYRQSKYGGDTPSVIGVLVFPTRAAAEDKANKTSVALLLEDPAIIKSARQNIKEVNQLDQQLKGMVERIEDPALAELLRRRVVAQAKAIDAERERVAAALFLNKPLVLKMINGKQEYKLLAPRLQPDYAVFELSSADDKPSYKFAILKLLIGALALIAGLRGVLRPFMKK